jgi:hypothetical protein
MLQFYWFYCVVFPTLDAASRLEPVMMQEYGLAAPSHVLFNYATASAISVSIYRKKPN